MTLLGWRRREFRHVIPGYDCAKTLHQAHLFSGWWLVTFNMAEAYAWNESEENFVGWETMNKLANTLMSEVLEVATVKSLRGFLVIH